MSLLEVLVYIFLIVHNLQQVCVKIILQKPAYLLTKHPALTFVNMMDLEVVFMGTQ